MFSTLLTLIAVILFLKQKRIIQFYIITLSALFPITLGNVRSIPNLFIIEWTPLLFLLIMLNDLISVKGITRNKKILSFKGGEFFLFAFIILMVWAIISYVNNEISDQNFSHGSASGVTRTYFHIINDLIIFISVIAFFYNYSNNFNLKKWLKIIIYFSIFAGIFALIGYLLHFKIPLFAARFHYGGESTMYGGYAYRMSGLETPATFGFCASLALFTIEKKFNYMYLIIFSILLFLSGGRSIWIASLFAFTIFFVMLFPSKLGYILGIGFLGVVVVLVVLPQKVIEGQLGRITAIDTGNLAVENYQRYAAYRLYLKNFSKNPIFGKGISEYEGFIYSTYSGTEEFAREMQFAGGHGSYLSIMSTFGIGGLIYLLIMVYGGIIYSFKLFYLFRKINSFYIAMSVFTLLMLLIKSVVYISSNSGLDDYSLYFIVALITSLKLFENKNAIQ